MQLLVIACLCYTAAISLSRAAMIAVALMFLLHFFRKPKLIWIGLISMTVGYVLLENSTIVERVIGRLEDVSEQQDDGFYSRGYLRIVNYPEYAFFGAAEGARYRFSDSAYSDQRFEIHSTFGTIPFSYSLIGLAAFAGAVWYLHRTSSFGYFLYILPPFLYGLTHQGLRFSFLWLLFSVIAVLGQTRPRREPRPLPRNSRQLSVQGLRGIS